jgi:hypothetical protein
MKKLLLEFKTGLLGSFTNAPGGFSSKKLTALAITICIVIAHIRWFNEKDFTQLTTVLTIDYGFILALFGINVVDKFKNPNKDTPSE